MPTELLNEAERFLIERWGEARLLGRIHGRAFARNTGQGVLFERIFGAIADAHPALDTNAVYATQFWGSGYLGFGRKSWPAGDTRWPSGLWIENLRLEVLAAEDSFESPYGYFWFSNKSKSDLDFDAAREAVTAAAKKLLSVEELKDTQRRQVPTWVLLGANFVKKSDLLRAFCEDDGQGFVELFVSQIELMARFVPVLDKVFSECLLKE